MIIRVPLSLGLCLVSLFPLFGQEKKQEQASPNFTDHVLPIFREHCLKCHNANDAEAGLAIDSYGALMEGGGSGDAVSEGDASASRLYLVMTHAEEPTMPPNQDPLAKEKLEVIRKWIDGGLLENSGSKAKKRKGPSLSFTAMEDGKPSEIVMPESLWRVPVVVSNRAAASSALATSPWAPLVAVAGQKQVSLYNTETAKLEGIIPFPEGIPQVLQFSMDGGYLMVAGGAHASKGVASVYNVKTGERLLMVGDELDTVFGADVNNDLTRVAMGGPQKLVRIFDTASGDSLFDLKKHTDWVYCVDFSPDGVLLASGDRSGGLHVWEADTGRLYLDLVGHKAAVRGLSWRADSNVLVSASEDGTVKLWEMNNGKQLKSFSSHGGGATGVVMAKDGRMVTSGKDKTVKLWNADGGAIATMPAFTEPALEAVITHDGTKIIGGDWTGRTVMWDIADPKKSVDLAPNPPRLEDHKSTVTAQIVQLNQALSAAIAAETAQQKALDAASASHAGLVAKLAQTKTGLAKANTDKAASEKMMADLQTQKAAFEKEMATAQASVTALQKLVTDGETLVKTQQKLMAEAVVRRDKAGADKAGKTAEIAKVKNQHEQLKVDAVASLSELTSRELEVAAMKQVALSTETQAENERKAVEGTVNQIKTQIADAAKTLQTNKEQLAVAGEQLKNSKAAEAAASAKVETALKAIQAKTALVESAKKQQAEAKDDPQKKAAADLLAKAEAELKTANDQKIESEKAVAAQKVLVANSTKLMADSNANMTATTAKQTALKVKSESAMKQLLVHTATRDAAAKQRAALDDQLTQIASQVAAAKKMKDEAIQKMAVLVKEETRLTGQQKTAAEAMAREVSGIKAAEAKIAEVTQAVAAASPKLDASRAQVTTVTGKLKDVSAKLKTQPEVVARHVAAIKQLTAAVPEFDKQIVVAKKTMDDTAATVTASKAATAVARKNVAQETAVLQGIESELVAFQQQGEKLAAEQQTTDAVAESTRKAVEPVQAEATKTAEAITAREAQMKQMAEAMAKLQAEIAGLNKAQAADQGTLEATRAKLRELEEAAEAAEEAAQETKQKVEFFKSVYGA